MFLLPFILLYSFQSAKVQKNPLHTFVAIDFGSAKTHSLFPFAKRHVYRVAKTLAYLFADVFPYSDDMAGCPHFHNLAVVWHAVECGVDGQTAFAEHRLDVERHLHVGGIHVFVLQDDGVKFQKFRHGSRKFVFD